MEIKKECEQYLAEHHQNLFFGNMNKRYRAMTGTELRKRVSRLTEANLRPLMKSNELSDVHAMLSKVCIYLVRREGHLAGSALKQWESGCRQMNELCEALARKDLEYVNGLSLEDLKQALKMQDTRRHLLTNSLERAYQLSHILKIIKKGILESVKQKPGQGYPGVREMKRRFVLHMGPTNSGKTHDALECLKECKHGAYFEPLRLLALEIYDKFDTEGPSCSMVTGEETLKVSGAVCQFCTVEMLNDHEHSDIVTVDECQMIADPHHRRNWTRAVLGLRVEEIHLHMAPETEDIVVQTIERCGDQYRVVRHKRNIRLTMEKKPYNPKQDLKKGGALVVLPEKSVLTLAAHLENEGIHYSAIYGSLPPVTRREQVYRFLARETEVMVSTGTIGMGLNLLICRIIFVETRRFDGINKRTLNLKEIEQVAGRAGRYGLYDEGFVVVIDKPEVIEDGLSRAPIPTMKVYVGFPEQLLNLPAEINTLVKVQAGVGTPSIYEKIGVDELLALYMSFEHVHRGNMEEYSRQEIYELITRSINTDNKIVTDLWKDYCRGYHGVTELEFPYNLEEDLCDLESYYKMLDPYLQFSRRVRLPAQAESPAEEKRSIGGEVSRILRTGCASHIRKCSACGKELSRDYPFSIRERCFERGRISRGRNRSRRRRVAGNKI